MALAAAAALCLFAVASATHRHPLLLVPPPAQPVLGPLGEAPSTLPCAACLLSKHPLPAAEPESTQPPDSLELGRVALASPPLHAASTLTPSAPRAPPRGHSSIV